MVIRKYFGGYNYRFIVFKKIKFSVHNNYMGRYMLHSHMLKRTQDNMLESYNPLLLVRSKRQMTADIPLLVA